MNDLKAKVIRGGAWVFALRIVGRGLGFIRTLILARLLAPEDFGLLGVAMLAISTLETFSQTGFQAALIQKQGDIEPYLDTAWTLSAIRGCLLFSLLFFGAPWIAAFFNSPDAERVIQAVAFLTLLGGLNNIGIVFFQKELDFGKKFLYEISSTLTDLLISVSLAFYLRSVWALVWGGLAAGLVRMMMSFFIHTYRPRLRLYKEKAVELFRFGRWITGSSIVIFIATQGDDIVVGKLFGVSALGIYQMAYLISNLPATEITHMISQVTFPAYSKIREGGGEVGKAFMLTLNVVSALAFPMVALTILLIPDFTAIFFGDKWMPIIWPVRLLALAGGIRAMAAIWGPLYLAQGQPWHDMNQSIVRIAFTFVPMPILIQMYGLNGIALAVVSGITGALIYDFLYLAFMNQKDIDPWLAIKTVIAYLSIIMPLTIVCYGVRKYLNQNIYSLLFIVILFGAAYAVCLEFFSRMLSIFPFRGISKTFCLCRESLP